MIISSIRSLQLDFWHWLSHRNYHIHTVTPYTANLTLAMKFDNWIWHLSLGFFLLVAQFSSTQLEFNKTNTKSQTHDKQKKLIWKRYWVWAFFLSDILTTSLVWKLFSSTIRTNSCLFFFSRRFHLTSFQWNKKPILSISFQIN